MRKIVQILALTVVLFRLGPYASAALIDIQYELARSEVPHAAQAIASDGTNFLVALQTTNNECRVQFLMTNGLVASPSLIVATNASQPRIAFGSNVYLIVWLGIQDKLCGRLLKLDGSPDGAEFEISSASVGEPGAVAYNGENFLVLWQQEAANDQNTASIYARFVSPAGSLIGPSIQCSAPNIESRAPAVSVDDSNQLISWIARTNIEWRVMARLMDKMGELQSADGTNHLVVWVRETGPFPARIDLYGYTNVFYPSVFGRFISSTGKVEESEIQLVRSRWGQENPTVSFNGADYLLVWADRRFSEPRRDNLVLSAESEIYGLTIRRDGTIPSREFIVSKRRSENPSKPNSAAAGGLTMVAAPFSNSLSSKIWLLGQPWVPESQIHRLTIVSNQDVMAVVSLPASTRRAAIETSTNMVDWQLLRRIPDEYSYSPPAADGTNIWPISLEPSVASVRFYRVSDAKFVCIENLRKLDWATFQWDMDTVELSRFAEGFRRVSRTFPGFPDFGRSRRVVGLCPNYANNSSRNWFCAVARPEPRKLMSARFIS